MRELTQAEKARAAELGLSEAAAAMAKGLGIPIERYAARLSAPADPEDLAREQAHMFSELARLAPTGREKLRTMAAEARRAARLGAPE